MYVPGYLEYHNFGVPHYLQAETIDVNPTKLPDMGINWFDLPMIFFDLGTLEKILDWCVLNKRPIAIIIEGASGEAKTSLMIKLLEYTLWRYSGIRLTPEIFYDFFLLGKYISLDPKIIAKLFKPRNFFVVDEFHLIASRLLANSKQNRSVNEYADTMREEQIFLIVATIFSGLIDKSFVNYKASMRIIVKYNSMKKNLIKFDVQVNCKGITHEKGEQAWEYIPLERDRRSPWCDKELWKLSKDLKEGMVYGRDIKAYQTSQEWVEQQTGENKVILRKAQEDFIFKNNTELKDIVGELMKAQYNQTDMEVTIKERLGKKVISYKKLKGIIREIEFENVDSKKKN